MDQESFRSLLGRSSGPQASTSRGSILPSRKPAPAPKTPSAQKPVGDKGSFKPRKVNKSFRDRAAERREGINDYAEVEGILEDFEKRNAGIDRDVVEEERKYLGGDEDHTILVKGLDFALLEQNKARVAAKEDEEADVALDEMLTSGPSRKAEPGPSSSETVSSKPKRSREERLAAMKRKRAEVEGTTSAPVPEDADSLERAKKMGKFRPIGAPPPAASKPTDSVKRKKKRKLVITTPVTSTNPQTDTASSTTPSISATADAGGGLISKEKPEATKALDSTIASPPRLSPAPPNPSSVQPPPLSSPSQKKPSLPQRAAREDPSDEDIFAEAGEYKVASDASDSSDSDSDAPKRRPEPSKQDKHSDVEMGEVEPARIGNWFGDDPDLAPLLAPPPTKTSSKAAVRLPRSRSNSRSPRAGPSRLSGSDADDDDEGKPPVPIRLQPLSSSFVPSVRDLLEQDKEAEALDKKKARKAKRKAAAEGTGEPVEKAPKKKLDKDQKLNRDYQQYTTYVEKKSKGDDGK